jgi:hypothetical protein
VTRPPCPPAGSGLELVGAYRLSDSRIAAKPRRPWPSVRAAARSSHRVGSARTIPSVRVLARRGGGVEAARPSRPAARRRGAGSSSSSSGASAFDDAQSSWQHVAAAARRRSDAATSTSEQRSRQLAQAPHTGRPRSGRRGSTLTTSSTSRCSTPSSCSAPTVRRPDARGRRGRRSAAAGLGEVDALDTRLRRPGSSATSSRRARHGRSPTSVDPAWESRRDARCGYAAISGCR